MALFFIYFYLFFTKVDSVIIEKDSLLDFLLETLTFWGVLRRTKMLPPKALTKPFVDWIKKKNINTTEWLSRG